MNYEKIFNIPVHSSELPDFDSMEKDEAVLVKQDISISQAARACFSTPEGLETLNYLVTEHIIPELDSELVVDPSGEKALLRQGARAVVMDILKRIRIAETIS